MTKFKIKIQTTLFALILASALIIGNSSCKQNTDKENNATSLTERKISITEQEVLDIQKAWSDGIVNIGKLFLEKGDYKSAAIDHINNFYNYQEGVVLFKPTLTSEKQFRTDFQGALSYFIGGDTNYSEDHGFAIKPWSKVRWETIGIKIIDNMAIAMGNYYFTPTNGENEVKVEYSFAYTKDKDNKLKIILHDSHLPYKPAVKH